MLDLAFDPTRLKLLAGALVAGLVVWAFVVFTSYRLVRPRERPRWHTVVGNLLVAGALPGDDLPRRDAPPATRWPRPTS